MLIDILYSGSIMDLDMNWNSCRVLFPQDPLRSLILFTRYVIFQRV